MKILPQFNVFFKILFRPFVWSCRLMLTYNPFTWFFKKLHLFVKYLGSTVTPKEIPPYNVDLKKQSDTDTALINQYSIGTRSANENVADLEPNYKFGMNKVDFYKYTYVLYKALTLRDEYQKAPSIWKSMYAEYLIHIKRAVVNLRFASLEREKTRLNFIEILDETFKKTFVSGNQQSVDVQQQINDVVEKSFAWGHLMGYTKGYLYAYDRFGSLDTQKSLPDLKILKHRLKIEKNIPPEDTRKPKEFYYIQRKILLKRIQEYLIKAQNVPPSDNTLEKPKQHPQDKPNSSFEMPENLALTNSLKSKLQVEKQQSAADKRLLEETKKELYALKTTVRGQNNELDALKRSLRGKDDKLLKLKNILREKNAKIVSTGKDLEEKNLQISNLVADFKKDKISYATLIKNYKTQVEELEKSLAEKASSQRNLRELETELIKMQGQFDILENSNIYLLGMETYAQLLGTIKVRFTALKDSLANENLPENIVKVLESISHRVEKALNTQLQDTSKTQQALGSIASPEVKATTKTRPNKIPLLDLSQTEATPPQKPQITSSSEIFAGIAGKPTQNPSDLLESVFDAVPTEITN
jgi:hypothetical protein